MATSHLPYQSQIKVSFNNHEHAVIVQECLAVDEELQPTRLVKGFQVDGPVLIINFSASDLKMLRVGMSSFFDMSLVSAKSILEFGDD
mmetsp:Transcript_28356/g.47669  ORF Transcript_28356/g.47669 Transcript_28356/m.47669 type:complete len:88 (-) Transcript_28356:306-569(-)|eukprot:CAMPEP_0174953864 /NCGR_PEP_ID=MMETSP0004_2-20121128/99_1 /TAXON_ID=420556 /ORGANISM="Ochromonas sp., Strain CCMP1393" /LENGTH=87 /DNA_ID=CAMNT_0016201601 /DNA_START=38 /DNA_END=301 /DNA_ORIENTATION=-